MAERPALEFEGKLYVRRSGTWVEAKTQMSVPKKLASVLDSRARADAALSDHCRRQDVDDAPAGRRSFTLNYDGEMTEHAVPLPDRTRSVTPKRARPGPDLLSVGFDREGQASVSCDIEPCWRRTEAAWRVGESTKVLLEGGYTLRFRVDVFEIQWSVWQRGYSGDWSSFRDRLADFDALIPQFSGVERQRSEATLRLHGRQCEWLLPLFTRGKLNPGLPWRRRLGSWRLRYADRVYEDRIVVSAPSCTLQRVFNVILLLVLKQEPNEPMDPVREWDLPLPSAGLPTLGKRR
jgi:hypothetical protein